MTDKIDELVAHAIAYTKSLLSADGLHWPVAKQGMRRMADNMRVGREGHPAIARLEAFIAEQDAIYAGAGTRH